MAVSDVAICNQALGWLGGELITSLSIPEDSDEWKLCNANYAPLRDAVLVEREWTFAIARAEFAALASAPTYGFDKAFQIPATALRVLQVTLAGDGVAAGGTTEKYTQFQGRYTAIEWQREGQTIVANGAERIYAKYIQQVTDTTKFSPAFDQALAARIAMDLAIPLTNSRLLQRDMAAMYGEKIAIAAASDGAQGRSVRTRTGSLIRVR